MKRIIGLGLALTLSVSLLAGCGGSKPEQKPASSAPAVSSSAAPVVSSPAPAPAAGAKVGLGHVVDIKKSKDFAPAKDGKPAVNGEAQINAVMAAVAIDGSGKILSVEIDNAQTKVAFDNAGKLVGDMKALQKTKVELGKDYGMIKASKIQKEWFEQINALEDWMKGKTIDEVKAMKTKKVDDAHPNVPDVADLTSKVTISVEGYIAAVEEAAKNSVALNGTFAKLGLGHQVDIAKSKDYTPAKDGKPAVNGQAQVNTVMTATAFDASGKVIGTKIDNAQVKVDFDNTGKVVSDKNALQKTKVELGKDYGMIKASKIQKEWFEQIAAVEAWMTGKTVADIKAMKTKKVDDAHPSVPDVADLTSKVTITVQDYMAVVEEAFKNAK